MDIVNNHEKSRSMIIHPVPLEIIMKVINSGQQTSACKVAELLNMRVVEEDVWPKEMIFLVFPPLSVKLHSELFESVLVFSIQRCELSIFFNLDFVGVVHGFWAGTRCMHFLSVLR